MEEENNGKKKTVLAVVLVLVLIVAVVGISYAMYRFVGTGTKENTITSGSISVAYAETSNIALTNQYSESDALGINNTEAGSTLQFTVSANITGAQTINYVVALDNVVPGATLTDEFVKIYMKKGTSLVTGFTEGAGQTVASFKTKKVTDMIDGYALTTGTFNATGSDTYTIKAWVSDQYKLPTTYTGTCSVADKKTPDACAEANGTWTDTTNNVHSNATTSETYSFKIKVVASSAPITIQ